VSSLAVSQRVRVFPAFLAGGGEERPGRVPPFPRLAGKGRGADPARPPGVEGESSRRACETPPGSAGICRLPHGRQSLFGDLALRHRLEQGFALRLRPRVTGRARIALRNRGFGGPPPRVARFGGQGWESSGVTRRGGDARVTSEFTRSRVTPPESAPGASAQSKPGRTAGGRTGGEFALGADRRVVGVMSVWPSRDVVVIASRPVVEIGGLMAVVLMALMQNGRLMALVSMALMQSVWSIVESGVCQAQIAVLVVWSSVLWDGAFVCEMQIFGVQIDRSARVIELIVVEVREFKHHAQFLWTGRRVRF